MTLPSGQTPSGPSPSGQVSSGPHETSQGVASVLPPPRRGGMLGIAALALAWLALALAAGSQALAPPQASSADRQAIAATLVDVHAAAMALDAANQAPRDPGATGASLMAAPAWTSATTDLAKAATAASLPRIALLAQQARAWPYAEAVAAASDYASLDAALTAASEAARAVQKQPALAQPPYAASVGPIVQEQQALDHAAFIKVFAPVGNRTALQQQWASHLGEEAKVLADALAHLRLDSSAPPAAVQALSDFSQATSSLAASASSLSTAASARLQVSGWPVAVAAAEKAALPRLFQAPPVARFGFLVPLGLLLVSATLVLAVFEALRYRTRTRLQEVMAQRARLAMGSVEKMTRELRDILRDDRPGARVTEDAASPAFSLSSMLNQVLRQRHAFADDALARGRDSEADLLAFARALHTLSEGMSAYVTRVNAVRERGYARAGRLAEMGNRVSLLRTASADTSGVLTDIQAATQETSWKSEALRADAQAQAKRAKRMGEGTQSLRVVSGLLRQTVRGIQIASVNAAVTSASMGEPGRDSLALAQEIERLAQAAVQSLQEMDTAIRDMQEDAKAAVSLTEQGTARVLETGACATRASTLVAGMERIVAEFPQSLDQVVGELEKRALAEAADVEEAAGLDAAVADLSHDLGELETQGQRALVTLRQFLGGLLPKDEGL